MKLLLSTIGLIILEITVFNCDKKLNPTCFGEAEYMRLVNKTPITEVDYAQVYTMTFLSETHTCVINKHKDDGDERGFFDSRWCPDNKDWKVGQIYRIYRNGVGKTCYTCDATELSGTWSKYSMIDMISIIIMGLSVIGGIILFVVICRRIIFFQETQAGNRFLPGFSGGIVPEYTLLNV